ncbi:MAG: tyrosine-type recombinase/integrase [Candidatus Diapherotrites archaeon]|uniref:Tyrosine-type recombinase/integrase n=1 Tax=Candidatus Iainarchaeum sp. TaxID=3101447 RepID=A0A8T3YLZ6_9ARCH|nr:tyrosine-type recombinase/integrase [Candidatus Diapherotrites archaeon]
MKWYRVDKHNIVKKLNPQEILTPEDIKALVTAAGSVRNKAIVFTLWESGCRISELLNARIGDLKFSEKVVSFFAELVASVAKELK